MKYSLRTWLANWRKQQSRRRPVRPIRSPLTLEHLEDRLAPAVITVNTTADTDARDKLLSFREAIELANGTLLYSTLTAQERAQVDLGNQGKGPTPDKSPSNTIDFNPAGRGTITITYKPLAAIQPLPGLQRPVTIRGGGAVTIDGGKNVNVGLSLNLGSSNSRIYGLTVQNFIIDGISVGSDSNRIGGSDKADKNTVQGNGTNIHIIGSGNRLIGNTILNAVSGGAGQFGVGVFIEGGSNNWVGKEADTDKGLIKTAANVISGNANIGVSISGGNGNNVVGNFIGLQADGKTQDPNPQQFGVQITGNSSRNVIGGATAGDRNTISGNAQYGVQVDSKGATNNQVDGNNIGTAYDGTDTNVGNKYGVVFTNGANANTVHTNRIKFNKNAGVERDKDTDGQNQVYDPNSIAFNSLGIDDGSNDGPVLTSATVSGNSITIKGTLASTPNTAFLLEFFGNSTEDPSGYGEGEFYLGNANVTTDANGNASFTVTLNTIYGSYVSATATNTASGGFTTAFSNDVAITGESQNASVSGEVWNDTIANGLLDLSESGASNVGVQLYAGGSLVASTTTDANGKYNFTNVTPGSYYLQFTAPSGDMFTPPYQGDDILSSHVDPTTGDTEEFSLLAGEDDPFMNAGILPIAAQPSTSTTLASDVNSSFLGTPVTFTATVSPTGNSIPLGGTVTFMDGLTTLGTVEVDPGPNGYEALFTAPNLSLGIHTIVAIYNGDGYNLGSSTSMTQTVTLAGSSTTLSSSGNAVKVGQLITFTATVTGYTGAPTDSVTFYDGNTVLSTVTLNDSGVATYTSSTLPLGTHDITAIFSGDSLFVSSSASLTQGVIRSQTDTTLDSSLDPSSSGQPVTFTATVTNRAGRGATPTGSVSFLDGTTVLDTATLDASGMATFTTSTLSTGNHLITAIYVGNGNFVGSSYGLIQSVSTYGIATTTTDVTAPPSEQGMILTATVTASSGTPTGSVTFLDGTSVLGTATLNSSGVATLQASPTPGDIVTAIYTGDSAHTGSSWYVLVPVYGSQTSTTLLSSSASPAWASQPLTFTATVSGSYGTPTGSVTFYDGTTVLGTATLNASGVATFTTSTLSLDSHDIVAIYSGDAVYQSSTGSLIQAVVQAATTTSLSSSANPSPSGQAVTFTATVAAVNPSAGTPTGTVDFYDGSTFLGTGTLSVVNGQVQATFTTSELEPGKHDIIAIYSGDNTFADSESSLEETISS